MNEVTIRLDSGTLTYYIKFQKDGAGVVVTITDTMGIPIIWERIGPSVRQWLTEVLA